MVVYVLTTNQSTDIKFRTVQTDIILNYSTISCFFSFIFGCALCIAVLSHESYRTYVDLNGTINDSISKRYQNGSKNKEESDVNWNG